MNVINAVGLIGGVASVAGLIYAIYYARQSRKIKSLVYESVGPVPLATAVSPGSNYKLGICFQRMNEPEEQLESVHVRFVRLANVGADPIRGDDVAPKNPLRIEATGVRTLDIALAGTTRAVNNVGLRNVSLTDRVCRAEITFDFLDLMDGAVIQILTVGATGNVRLCGDIVGMPAGIKTLKEAKCASKLLGIVNKIGGWLAFSFELWAIVLSVYSFRWITGSWNHVWILALPFVALVVPLIIIVIVAATIWPRQTVNMPANLCLPDWYKKLSVCFPGDVVAVPEGGVIVTNRPEEPRKKHASPADAD